MNIPESAGDLSGLLNRGVGFTQSQRRNKSLILNTVEFEGSEEFGHLFMEEECLRVELKAEIQ